LTNFPARYYPYGQEREATPEGTEKFATYYRDATGLDYAWNRYYTAAWGRFMQADPYLAPEALKNPQAWNRYAYVAGDPVSYYDPAGLFISVPERRPRIIWVVWLAFESSEEAFTREDSGLLPPPAAGGRDATGEIGGEFFDLEAGGSSLPRWLQVVLDRRQALLAAIYGTGDDVFGGEILDCMAGRESAWDPAAVGAGGFAQGLFQISKQAWQDVYEGTINPSKYDVVVNDPGLSAAAAAAYLRILLSRIVGRERYLARDYSEGDLKKAIQA